MSMQMVYAEGSDKAAEYKSYLADNAHQMGLRPEDVSAMKAPVLVRVIDTKEHDEKLLVRQMNESFMQAMDPRTMQVAMGRRLTENTLKSLAENMPGSVGLRQFLGGGSEGAGNFIAALRSAGVIDARNENQYMTRKGRRQVLNEDGKTLVERILVGKLVGDAYLLPSLPPSIVTASARAVPHLIQAEGYGQKYNVRSSLRTAMLAYGEFYADDSLPNTQGRSPAKIDEEVDLLKTESRLIGTDTKGGAAEALVSGAGSSEEEWLAAQHPVWRDPMAEELFRTLLKRGGPKQMASTFKRFATKASNNVEGQGGLDLGVSETALQMLQSSVTETASREKKEDKQEAVEDTGQESLLKAQEEMRKLAGWWVERGETE